MTCPTCGRPQLTERPHVHVSPSLHRDPPTSPQHLVDDGYPTPEPARDRVTIPPAGTEYDPRMGVPHVIGGIEHDRHPGEPCAVVDGSVHYDLRDAVELMDTKITPYGEREDGTTSAYIVSDSTWHRVLAVARGNTSDKARAAIDSYRAALAAPGEEALRMAALVVDAGREVWAELERLPGFSERIAKGRAQLDAGQRVPFDPDPLRPPEPEVDELASAWRSCLVRAGLLALALILVGLAAAQLARAT